MVISRRRPLARAVTAGAVAVGLAAMQFAFATPRAYADAAWDALQAQFGTATSGTTITLTQDVTGDPGEGLVVPNGMSVTLDLAGHRLSINGDSPSVSGVAGIQVVGAGTNLTIADSSAAHSGHLIAQGGRVGVDNGGAGIGAPGATSAAGATVTITGGTVDAYGGWQAAGIGGADYPGGSVVITGGKVTATGGGDFGTGIGGGWSSALYANGGGTLDIYGTAFGSVAANGGDIGSGVGTAAGAVITPYSAPARFTSASSPGHFTISFGQVLSFDTGGGSAIADAFVPQSAAPTAPADPTLAHHAFGGWYADSALTTPFDFSAPLTADTTIHAKWTLDQYPVSFDLGGHGSGIADESIGYNLVATQPADPTETGYTFGGWYADFGLATPYDFNAAVTGPVSLYAKWMLNQYPVTFDLEGHGTSIADESVGYNLTATPPADPVETGYTFGGWYTGPDLTTPFDFAAPVTADTTAYAKWTLDQYLISFDLGGHSTPITAESVGYGLTAAQPAEPTETGYIFGGWYSDSALTAPYDFSTPVTAPLTLYAKWAASPAPIVTPTPSPSPSPAPSLTPTASPAPIVAPAPTVHVAPAVIVAPVSTPTPSPSPTPSPAPVPAGATPTPAPAAMIPPTDGSAPPSAVTGSLPNVRDVASDIAEHPEHLAFEAAAGLVWILLLVFVVRTLGEALRHRYRHWSENIAQRHPVLAGRLRWTVGLVEGPRALTLLVSVVLTAVIMWLVEPAENGSVVALRLLGSVFISVVATNLLTRALASILGRLLWGIRTAAFASGWGLMIGLLGLVISRAVQFVPGLLEPSTILLNHRDDAPQRAAMRVEAVRGWLAIALAIGAWFGASAVPQEGTWSTLLWHDALVLIAVGGIFGLFTDLIPMPALLGGGLWTHARKNWIALSIITAVAFAVIVVPHSSNWLEVGDIGRWIAIAVVAALAAVTIIVTINWQVHREHAQQHRTPADTADTA